MSRLVAIAGRVAAILGRAAAVAALSAALMAASAVPGSPAVSSCAAAGSHHAALVVQHGNGAVVSRCVGFDADSVTGEALLSASGVSWSGQVFGGFGNAVCAVDNEPARYSVCPGTDYYWAVFVSRGGGAWQLSGVGISSLNLANGDAEGLMYIPAVGGTAVLASPAGVCSGAAATPRVGATGAATPRSTAGAASSAGAAGSPVAGESPAASTGTVTVAGATSGPTSATTSGDAAASARASAATGAQRPAPAPSQNQGPDLGLLVAAVAGGGLAGLGLLRLMTMRHRGR